MLLHTYIAASAYVLIVRLHILRAQRLENKSVVYGGGLRAAEQMWRALGGDRSAFERLLQRVKTSQSFGRL